MKHDKIEERTPTGKIVGIIRRKWRQYCGILQKNPLTNVSNFNLNMAHIVLNDDNLWKNLFLVCQAYIRAGREKNS